MFVLSQTCPDACMSQGICLRLLHPKRFTMPVGDNTYSDNTNRGGEITGFICPMYKV